MLNFDRRILLPDPVLVDNKILPTDIWNEVSIWGACIDSLFVSSHLLHAALAPAKTPLAPIIMAGFAQSHSPKQPGANPALARA
jgi:hypothetical protein